MWRCSLDCIQHFQQWSFVQAVSCCLTHVRKDDLSWSDSPDTFWSSWLKTGCDDVPVKSLQFAWSQIGPLKKMKKGLNIFFSPENFTPLSPVIIKLTWLKNQIHFLASPRDLENFLSRFIIFIQTLVVFPLKTIWLLETGNIYWSAAVSVAGTWELTLYKVVSSKVFALHTGSDNQLGNRR